MKPLVTPAGSLISQFLEAIPKWSIVATSRTIA
jgi:hypothetical protein